jgi:hypothetical protein
MHSHRHSRCSLLALVPAAALLGCKAELPTAAAILPETFSGAALTTTVTDPVGDAVASDGKGLTGEGYQDIVGGEVSQDGGVFSFAMDVAGSVPASPVLPGGITVQEWSWNINTGPESPSGFPFAPGNAVPPEFIVAVQWDGASFTGSLIDRRPLLGGGEVVITPVPFDIDGARVTAAVNANRLGNPSSFSWILRTNDWPRLGTNSVQTLDRAPDAVPATWP